MDTEERLSNVAVRRWYDARSKEIPRMIDPNASLEQQARQAHELRNAFRTQARAMMKDQSSAAELEKTRPNKEFEALIRDKINRKGITREDAYRDTIDSAARTNKRVNHALGLEADTDD